MKKFLFGAAIGSLLVSIAWAAVPTTQSPLTLTPPPLKRVVALTLFNGGSAALDGGGNVVQARQPSAIIHVVGCARIEKDGQPVLNPYGQPYYTDDRGWSADVVVKDPEELLPYLSLWSQLMDAAETKVQATPLQRTGPGVPRGRTGEAGNPRNR